MSQRLYMYKQLNLLFREVADWSSASMHKDLAPVCQRTITLESGCRIHCGAVTKPLFGSSVEHFIMVICVSNNLGDLIMGFISDFKIYSKILVLASGPE